MDNLQEIEGMNRHQDDPEITQCLVDAFALRLALETDTRSASEVAAYLLDETTALYAMEIAEHYCERGYADAVRCAVARSQDVAPQHLCDDWLIKATAYQRLTAWLKFMGGCPHCRGLGYTIGGEQGAQYQEACRCQ